MDKKIAITNTVAQNPGDAAILSGMVAILKKKYGRNAEIVVFDQKAEIASNLCPWVSFRQAPFHRKMGRNLISRAIQHFGYGHWIIRFRYWRLKVLGIILRARLLSPLKMVFYREDIEDVEQYLASDLIVSTGGTYLVENYGLWRTIYDYRLCLSLDKPLVLFTQSLGPFTKPKYKKAFNEIFSRASVIFLRDERSKQHLIDIGIPEERMRLAKDAAFALRGPTVLNKRRGSGTAFKVAISVRSLHFFDKNDRNLWQTYLESVRAMVETLTHQFQAEVVFLSTCQGIPGYWTNDAAVADEVLSGLSSAAATRTTIDRRFRQPAEIVDAYSQFDLVIATRMHASILSLIAGTPAIGIAYEFKLEELFSQLGMQALLLPILSINPDSAKETTIYAVHNIERLRKGILGAVEMARSDAYSTLDSLPDLTTAE